MNINSTSFPVRLWIVILAWGVATHSIALASDQVVSVRAGEAYLEVFDGQLGFQPFYVNGVNLSGVLPGNQAFEPSQDPAVYLRWFGLMAEMNCNTIRVFKTMPPAFYQALKLHNQAQPKARLRLIQGIWVELPEDGDFSNPQYTAQVKADIASAIDAVHGRSCGADVSGWLLAYLFGREWEPQSVIAFNQMYPQPSAFTGRYISSTASPMECWLAEMCNEIVKLEEASYQQQHPVSFVNWVATDPLDHLQGYKDKLGADFTVPAEVMGDFRTNDAVSLSVANLVAGDDFQAGLYSSYHVYPYYPDFLSRQPQYARVYDREGPNNFLGYLKELKSHYGSLPLLITEYGLPSSPLAAHRHPQGWHHGGLSEKQVAEVLPRLTKAIYNSGCAGGAVFSWTDGWFKRVWLWNRFYNPGDESRLWFNLLDPEQNFGLLALEPKNHTPITLSGNLTEWAQATQLTPVGNTSAVEPLEVWATHDEGYFYLRMDLQDYDDWQFENHSLYIGLNVAGDGFGNTSFPFPLHHESEQGIELMLVFSNGQARLMQSSTFRFWPPLKAWAPNILAQQAQAKQIANRAGWILPQVQTNSPVLGSSGQVIQAQAWPLNPLRRGSLVAGDSFDSQAIWNVNADTEMLELRLPWMLAGFIAPHRKRVLEISEDGSAGYSISEGIGVSFALGDPQGNIYLSGETKKYTWDEWRRDGINFVERLKPAYYSLKEAYGSFPTTTEPSKAITGEAGDSADH